MRNRDVNRTGGVHFVSNYTPKQYMSVPQQHKNPIREKSNPPCNSKQNLLKQGLNGIPSQRYLDRTHSQNSKRDNNSKLQVNVGPSNFDLNSCKIPKKSSSSAKNSILDAVCHNKVYTTKSSNGYIVEDLSSGVKGSERKVTIPGKI